jgi:hypothetical protein
MSSNPAKYINEGMHMNFFAQSLPDPSPAERHFNMDEECKNMLNDFSRERDWPIRLAETQNGILPWDCIIADAAALFNDVVFGMPQRPIKTREYMNSLSADELMEWREPLQRGVIRGEWDDFLFREPPPQRFV